MLVGLLQLENSNFEGVLRRKFNVLSRDTYGLASNRRMSILEVLHAGNLLQ